MIEYKACDFFVTRLPILPINTYFEIFAENTVPEMKSKLFNLFKETFLGETLAIASSDSYKALNRLERLDDSKSSEQMVSTLVKYFIRLSTRPTPYGLFSGVSVGNFGSKTNMVVSTTSKSTKRARVDMEWLYAVIRDIESNKNIRKLLNVKFNDYVYENGDRLEKPNKTILQINSDEKEISTTIRYTKQVKSVREMSKNFIRFSELLHNILKQAPGIPAEMAEKFLNQLLENEFLLSELRPPLINTDALSYAINVLDNIEQNPEVKKYLILLNSIKESIIKYNLGSIGNGLDDFNLIIEEMHELCESANYLQVDTRLKMDDNMLSYSLKNEIEEFVAAMLKITPEYNVSDDYAHYLNLFMEKYGNNMEVPVLELLDMDKGLGAPSYYTEGTIRRVAPRQQKGVKELRLEKLLERKLFIALKENKRILEINDQDIDYIAADDREDDFKNASYFLQSFELFLLMHPCNSNAKEGNIYNFTVAPVFASNGIGKAFGRFRDMFSKEETSCFEKEFKKQKESLSEYIIAEIAEVPELGRTSNVSVNISDYDYQIMLTTNSFDGKKTLSINDLYIGVDRSSGQFYIRSRSLNKKVIVTMTSMLNPLRESNAVRFLTEISSVYRFNITNTISNIVNVNYEYCPRITYKHIIIRPETWIISKDILNLKDNNNEAFIESFRNYQKQWSIPRYVLLTEFDNRLLLDLENALHLNVIYSIISKENARVIKLAEISCNFDEYAAKDTIGNHYITEVVIPFTLSTDNKDIEGKMQGNRFFLTRSDVKANCLKVNGERRVLLPCKENWLYFKLYGYSKRKNELIAVLYEQLEQLITDNKASNYFFIRYADPEPHLRVRVKSANNELANVFEILMALFEKARMSGLVSKVEIDTYERETGRYGGTELIEKAEEYFYFESRMVMKIISTQHKERSYYNFDYIGVSFIVMALNAFRLSFVKIEAFLSSVSNQNAFRKEFKEDRKMFINAVDIMNQWKEIRTLINYPEVYDNLMELSIKLTEYADAVYKIDKEGMLTNSIQDIASSIIHMFCNRLIGNNTWERKVYALARHGTYSLKGILMHRK